MATELAIFGGPRTIGQQPPHFRWPRITERESAAVLRQLNDTISIYGDTGIFGDFERSFAEFHGRKFALLFNSGTSALHACYFGLELSQGDEVICPTYTFFATVTPLLQTGARPVFVDADPNGNIDPLEVERAITPRTKAIVVTHMWGFPASMDEIRSIAEKHGLRIVEDCSHAHGAKFQSKIVGTFGETAAWSLQGAKTVTGGEGGIMLTDNERVFQNALLLGHYNTRCKKSIPKESPLHKYALTGFGLKLRAHPLAIAIAMEQFRQLEVFLAQRQRAAAILTAAFTKYEFFNLPRPNGNYPSWYAFIALYDSKKTGVSRECLVRALHAEGLVEVDVPSSTCPLHDLPLFTSPPTELFSGQESIAVIPKSGEWKAVEYFRQAIKLPVWSFADEEPMVTKYAEGICKVADGIKLLAEIC